MTQNRVQWVDYAKGISIILVVLHHSMFSELYSESISFIDGLLGRMRMPLFFFISGLFIYKSMTTNLASFLKFKVTHLLYIYVLWNIIKYLTDTLPRYFILGDTETNLNSIFNIFVNPPGTLWFIYALLIFLIITRLTNSFPPWLTMLLALVVFTFSVFYEINFLTRIAKFYPFFLFGYFFSNFVITAANKVRAYHIIFPIFFLWLMSIVQESSGFLMPLVSFLLSSGGIISGIIIASLLSRLRHSSWLEYIGQNTFAIYVMHYLPIGIMKAILPIFLSEQPELAILIMVTIGVTLPLIVSKIAKIIGMNWLFKVPFMTNNKRILISKEIT